MSVENKANVIAWCAGHWRRILVRIAVFLPHIFGRAIRSLEIEQQSIYVRNAGRFPGEGHLLKGWVRVGRLGMVYGEGTDVLIRQGYAESDVASTKLMTEAIRHPNNATRLHDSTKARTHPSIRSSPKPRLLCHLPSILHSVVPTSVASAQS